MRRARRRRPCPFRRAARAREAGQLEPVGGSTTWALSEIRHRPIDRLDFGHQAGPAVGSAGQVQVAIPYDAVDRDSGWARPWKEHDGGS